MGAATSAGKGLAGYRVLVAEDEYFIAIELVQALKANNAEVIGPVPSIAAALHLIRTVQHIDGALLDVRLRGEMAFPVADALLERGVPFAFVTAYGQGMIPPHYAGVNRHEKPVDLARIVDLLPG